MKSEDRKKQIVDATLRIVAEYGVQGTSTKRIAAAAGISEAMLYRHFASRNEMLDAAMDVIFERIYGLIDGARGADVRTRLMQIAEGHVESLSSAGGGFAVPLFEFVAAPPESGLRDSLGRRQLVAVQAIAAIVAEGKADGSVAEQVDPLAAAWMLTAVFWMRDVAYLMGLADSAAQGSAMLLDTVLHAACTGMPVPSL